MSTGRSAVETHPLIAWFAANSVVANLLMFAILGLGIHTALTIRRESFPSLDAQNVRITVPFRGGTPEDVERGVTIRIEEAIEDLEGIEHVRSESTETRAEITVEAEERYPLQRLLDDIKVRVDAIPTLPEQVENIVIAESRRRNSVIWVEVYGEVPEAVLKETARDLRDRLRTLPSVSVVRSYGARDYELSIEVSEERLRALDLSFAEVAEAVRRESLDLSGGVVRSDRGEITLRFRNQAYRAAEFAALPVRRGEGGGEILVGDVATVRDGFVDQEVLSRFDGLPTVSLQILNEGRDDIVKASADTRAELGKLRAEGGLPAGVEVKAWNDESLIIASRLRLLTRNGLVGMGLVLISLALFLNLRLAIWVAVGIPISLAGAVMLMGPLGLSLNSLTTFAFIVVLGIVVDDAIVIGESVFAEKRRSGENGLEVTVRGVGRVLVPAAFGVLTTIATFYPLSQTAGRRGQAFAQIATVVILCLVFSMVESKLILPAHLAHIDVNRRPRFFLARWWLAVQNAVNATLRAHITYVYQPALRLMMSWRYATVAVFVAAAVLVLGMRESGRIRQVPFPAIEREAVAARLVMEQGQPVARLHEIALRLEAAIVELGEEIEAEAGERVVLHTQVQASNNQNAAIVAKLSPSEGRKTLANDIVNRWRRKVGALGGVKALTFSARRGPPSQGLVVELRSEDLEALRAAAADMRGILARLAGVYDIKDSFETGKPEIVVRLTDIGRASGVTQETMAREVRAAFYGREAQRVQRGRDEVRVMVRYPIEDRARLEQLRRMRVATRNGNRIPFDVAADLQYRAGFSRIERIDGRRMVQVEGELDDNVLSSSEGQVLVSEQYLADFEQAHPLVETRFSGVAEERAKSNRSLQSGFLYALVAIYVLLAIPLRSYTKPLMIMAVIPFGIMGAVFGHWIVGMPLSILSLFGIVALSGVVVNDSLVLVCAVDRARAEGLGLREALLESGGRRFRAILLTSITTFAGLIPILTETAMQAQFLKPMAVSLGFGVLFATPVTLVLVPMLYLVNADIGAYFREMVRPVRNGPRAWPIPR